MSHAIKKRIAALEAKSNLNASAKADAIREKEYNAFLGAMSTPDLRRLIHAMEAVKAGHWTDADRETIDDADRQFEHWLNDPEDRLTRRLQWGDQW